MSVKENEIKTKVIRIKKLDEKAFAKYGQFQNLLDDEALAARSIFPYGWGPVSQRSPGVHGRLPPYPR